MRRHDLGLPRNRPFEPSGGMSRIGPVVAGVPARATVLARVVRGGAVTGLDPLM